MRFVSRAGWDARPPTEPWDPVPSNRGVKVHYLGAPFVGLEHWQCDGHVRSVQNMHMDNRGYRDIGYNLIVCQHGYVYDGRGKNALCAANGLVPHRALQRHRGGHGATPGGGGVR